jgi:hypothetical protein
MLVKTATANIENLVRMPPAWKLLASEAVNGDLGEAGRPGTDAGVNKVRPPAVVKRTASLGAVKSGNRRVGLFRAAALMTIKRPFD